MVSPFLAFLALLLIGLFKYGDEILASIGVFVGNLIGIAIVIGVIILVVVILSDSSR